MSEPSFTPVRPGRAELASGLLVTALGLLGLAASWDLERGVLRQMGPGYLPATVSWLIIAGGVVMIATAMLKTGKPLPDFQFRPLAVISAGIALFGLTIDSLGILAAIVILIIVCGFASPITRFRENVVLAVCLAAASALIFVKLLGLAIPILPR
ncbi:tripartite tricarboxylate transporter TctB family protein [Bosea sp. MMO-172]|uniref:tripartite tricarboxylate transporter TctB family protein n=1 Tax=Bosea sp. MMO-172 TaxID=3127885 RepID=UPI003017A654